MCVCVRACVRACVRMLVCVCVCLCERERERLRERERERALYTCVFILGEGFMLVMTNLYMLILCVLL